jgi:hypothetical protein
VICTVAFIEFAVATIGTEVVPNGTTNEVSPRTLVPLIVKTLNVESAEAANEVTDELVAVADS